MAAPKDQRKEEVVAPYDRQFTAAEGVVAILTSTESGRTFVSYTPRYPPSGVRTETCPNNNTHDVGLGRHLDNLPALHERMRATNQLYLDAQADLLASTVDTGALAHLARPVHVGARRVRG